MTKIYQQHDAAFANVQAHVILKDGQMVAKIAFKFPKDGAGRLYAYVHWFGIEMVRGHANGCGYDKRSAAVEDAIGKVNQAMISPEQNQDSFIAFQKALIDIGGNNWDQALRDAGFTVFQAV